MQRARLAGFSTAVCLFVANTGHAQGDPGAPPGRIVDAAGRRMHVHCTGSGSPTVVFEAGASSFAIDWALVQPEIARTNRACSYDRLGHGWSETPSVLDTAVVGVLHTLLATAGEKPPFVLVGASRGGLYVRLYQARYPRDVSGLVLVDPAHEGRLFTMLGGEALAIAALTPEQLAMTIRPGTVRIPKRRPQTGEPFTRLPPELYRVRVALDERLIASFPDTISGDLRATAMTSEWTMLSTLHRARVATPHPLGDLPLVVLSRGMDTNAERDSGFVELARMSRRGRHAVIADSGHEIHLFQPGAVIQAIRDVLP